MDDPQGLHILEAAHQLYGKPSYQSFLKACVVVHLDELVQIKAVQIESHAQMVSEDEVVLYLDDAFFVLDIVFLNQEK